MKTKIFTRSMNEDLYKMASEFWPTEIEKERCTQFNYWEGALDFLYYVIESDVDFALIIDEDCFIYDWKIFEHCLTKMKLAFNLDALTGMPDTISNSHHRFGPDYSFNPFLLILDCRQIRIRLKETNKLQIQLDAPESNELFYPLFYWLKNNIPTGEFKGQNHKDNISTEVLGDYFGKETPFALHSWYSREFETVPEQKERILNLYNEAKSLQQ